MSSECELSDMGPNSYIPMAVTGARNSQRSKGKPWRLIACAALGIIILSAGFLHSPAAVPDCPPTLERLSEERPAAARNPVTRFAEAWQGLRLKVAPTRSLPESWPPTLGDPGIEAGQKIPEVLPQDVCVMSSDDRPVRPFLRTADHYLADDNAPIAELDYPSANLYYNFFWALRHGYRYIRVKGVAPEGWGATWGKVEAILSVVKQCKWTVFFDGDAFPTDPAMDLPAMMKKLGFHDRAKILVSAEPPQWEPDTNTGFWIIKQSKVATDALERIMRCPDEIPGCDRWKTNWAHEQRAWNEYIRPTLRPEDIVVPPCYYTNGWWGLEMPDLSVPIDRNDTWGANGYCRGTVVSHAWFGKGDEAVKIRNILGSEMLAWLSQAYEQYSA